jgi:hypothetical protein
VTTFTAAKTIIPIILCLILLLLMAPERARCEDTYIRNIFVTNSPTHLQLQFQLYNSFSAKMKEAIQTGIPTVFEFHIELYQNRAAWNDQRLTALIISRTIKYDTLKQEYILTEGTNVNGTSTEVMSSLDEAMEFMNNVKISSFYPMWKLERNKSYYFRIKARSEGIAPPGYMHYILFFMNWMNFDTEWMVERFYY